MCQPDWGYKLNNRFFVLQVRLGICYVLKNDIKIFCYFCLYLNKQNERL